MEVIKENIGMILTAITTFVVGGITTYFTFKSKMKETDATTEAKFRDQLLSQVNSLTVQMDALRADNAQLHGFITELKLENQRLNTKLLDQFNYIEIIKSYYEHMPVPAWMKDKEGRMFFINTQYEKNFGITKMQYHNRTDIDVWGEEVGELYREHDNRVIKNGRGIETQEKVPLSFENPNGPYNLWKIVKYPIYIDNEVFGVGGMAIEKINKNPIYEK